MKQPELHKALRAQGLTVTKLAEQFSIGRSHLSQVLANKPGRGGQTRRKIARYLPPVALQLLGWDVRGNLITTETTAGNARRRE